MDWVKQSLAKQELERYNLIRMALARGYCKSKNSHKELDSDLINAMADEIMDLQSPERICGLSSKD